MLATLTPTLLACCGITAVIHLASTTLHTLLPFHLVALGGSKTQIGLLFSVTTAVSMLLRPVVGGLLDRYGVLPVLLPGIGALAVTSVVFQFATTAAIVVLLMAGVGVANGLVSTTSGVVAAGTTGPARRGEALSLYYLASSLAVAAAPPLALALLWLGGMPLAFAAVSGLAGLLAGVTLSLPASATAPAPGAAPRFHLVSRYAVPASGALALTTMGHSAIYGFLPLYATSRGQRGALGFFFVVYPLWLTACRALFGRLSDRLGRARVIVPAMACVAVGFFVLALPPGPASLAVAALFLGSGSAVLYPTLVALVADRAPDGERGLALGTLSGAWDLGVVVGSALVGVVIERYSYGAGFAVGGLAAVLGLATFVVTERRRRPALLPGRAAPA
jgi:MFS family permease